MYLITAYFDDHTNRILNRYIERIATQTGNHFMEEHHVPPHLTISSLEARAGQALIPAMEKMQGQFETGSMEIVSVGALFPYVLYATPVLNVYLQNLSSVIYEGMNGLPEVSVNRYYRPLQWLPHITLGKTLTKEQMQMAFAIMQEQFVPFTARITQIGLASTNPHEDIWIKTM